MNEMSLRRFIPEKMSPLREDPPGTVTSMPSPAYIGHMHIVTGDNYAAMVDFYVKALNGEIVNAPANHNLKITFISFDDADHRIAMICVPGAAAKPMDVVGDAYACFCFRSLGELLFHYRQMKAWGHVPERTVNHGNSTSFYYRDPDGNRVEFAVENFSQIETKLYKRHYQFSPEFGRMAEGDFNPDKLVALYEAGVPDQVLLDREKVKAMVAEGTL